MGRRPVSLTLVPTVPPGALSVDRQPVTITVAGAPVGFARNVSPRAVGGTIKYRPIPLRQQNAFAAIRWAAQLAMRGGVPFSEPVRLDMIAIFEIPVSWSKRKQQAAMDSSITPSKRPDISNIIKLVEDALNTVVFRDDCLVVELHCQKIYGMTPMLRIAVSPVFRGAAA